MEVITIYLINLWKALSLAQGKHRGTEEVLTKHWLIFWKTPGFPDSSVGKESTCNAGDPGSIPESGRSAGEEIGYPLQYSWASLVAQLVKNPSAMREDLGSIPRLERSTGEGKGYSLQYSGLENSMDCIVHGVTKSQTRLSDSLGSKGFPGGVRSKEPACQCRRRKRPRFSRWFGKIL